MPPYRRDKGDVTLTTPLRTKSPFLRLSLFHPSLSLSSSSSSSQSILDALPHELFQFDTPPVLQIAYRIIGFCQAAVWFLYNKTSWEKEEKFRKNRRVYLYYESNRLHLIPFPFSRSSRCGIFRKDTCRLQHRCRLGGGIDGMRDEFMHPITFFNSSMA